MDAPTTPATDSDAAESHDAGMGDQSVGQMLLATADRHAGIALQYWQDGLPAYISYPELGAISNEIARGLISLGIQPGDRVAVLGLTSADWTLADCGALCAGAVVTPIYHTSAPIECAYVLEHSGARVIFCENAAQAAKIEQVRDQCPNLEHTVLFEGGGSDVLTLDELRRIGLEVPPDAVAPRSHGVAADDLATLVYTSGTTGPPKGCMLSHKNLLATAQMYVEQLHFNETPRAVSVPPARPRARSRCPDRRPQRRRPDHLLERRSQPRSSTSCSRPRRHTSPPFREFTRRSTARRWDACPTGPGLSGRCSNGRCAAVVVLGRHWTIASSRRC